MFLSLVNANSMVLSKLQKLPIKHNADTLFSCISAIAKAAIPAVKDGAKTAGRNLLGFNVASLAMR